MLNQLSDDLIYYKLLLFLNCYDRLFLVNKNMNNLLSCKLRGIKCYSKPKVYLYNKYFCSVCNPSEFRRNSLIRDLCIPSNMFKNNWKFGYLEMKNPQGNWKPYKLKINKQLISSKARLPQCKVIGDGKTISSREKLSQYKVIGSEKRIKRKTKRQKKTAKIVTAEKRKIRRKEVAKLR